MLWTILAILAIGIGLLVSLFFAVFLMGCMPNSSPKQLRFLTLMAWTVAIIGVLSSVIAGVFIHTGQPQLAAMIGVIPVLICIVCVIISIRGT